MTDTRAPATVQQGDWGVMKEQATMLVKTGFLPKAVDTPEKAVAIMLKGRELGVPPMYALSNIAVISGKPVAGAELMLALIYRDHGDNAVKVVESTNKICTVEYKRRTWPKYERYSFTIEDAATAGLSTKDTWKAYPAALLRARCISAVARMAFPDSIGGMYTPEELGAEVTISNGDTYEIESVATSVPLEPVDTSTGEVLEGTVEEADQLPNFDEPHGNGRGPASDENILSDAQMKKIHVELRNHDIDAETANAETERLYGCRISDLSKANASKYIELILAGKAGSEDPNALCDETDIRELTGKAMEIWGAEAIARTELTKLIRKTTGGKKAPEMTRKELRTVMREMGKIQEAADRAHAAMI